MRWDLIEKFEVLRKGEFAKALRRFSGQEDFFAENFPGKPLVPEPLMIEMVAQTGGVLFGFGFDFKKEVILAKIAKAEFFDSVAPPCLLTVEARIDDEREEGAWISGEVLRDGKAVADDPSIPQRAPFPKPPPEPRGMSRTVGQLSAGLAEVRLGCALHRMSRKRVAVDALQSCRSGWIRHLRPRGKELQAALCLSSR